MKPAITSANRAAPSIRAARMIEPVWIWAAASVGRRLRLPGHRVSHLTSDPADPDSSADDHAGRADDGQPSAHVTGYAGRVL
jgi:hypothetical protein